MASFVEIGTPSGQKDVRMEGVRDSRDEIIGCRNENFSNFHWDEGHRLNGLPAASNRERQKLPVAVPACRGMDGRMRDIRVDDRYVHSL